MTASAPAGLRMPAEWEPHRATWIAWPHHEPDWPGKLGPIPWVYAEIARVIADHEPLEILCHDEAVLEGARLALDAHAVRRDRIRTSTSLSHHRIQRRTCKTPTGSRPSAT